MEAVNLLWRDWTEVALYGSDIYFIGGFGTVAWVDVKEYEALMPDKIAVDGGEQNLKVFLKAMCVILYLPVYISYDVSLFLRN